MLSSSLTPLSELAAAAAPAPRRKIAYLKRGAFSYSNERTAEQLRLAFPEFEVEEIDVGREIWKPHPGLLLPNLASIGRHYWRQLCSRRLTLRQCFYRTPFAFQAIRAGLQRRLDQRRSEYVFSFQTQSLFDGSNPGLPHFVYTDHTHLTNLYYPGFPRDQLYARAWIDLEQEIYRHAAHVFVMSEHVRRSLQEHYGCAAADSTCVLAGSNLEISPLPLTNDDYRNQTIVFVGLDWERKGGPTLLAAFTLVLQQLPQARLIIVGCEPRVQHPQIEVKGRLEREAVRQQLVRGSVFCLPTRIEPFGIAAVEAFSHRLPVVASDLGAMSALVQDGVSGRLIPPDDPKALAAALVELLADPAKCRSMGEHGFQTVQGSYTWESVGRRVREVITGILAHQVALAPGG